jgi:hypothetical protein
VLSIPGVTPSKPEKFFRDCLIILGGEEEGRYIRGDFLDLPEPSEKVPKKYF